MGGTVSANDLGLSIFGTAQVDYVVDGEKGCTYDQAVAKLGLMRAVAVENAIPAYTAAIRARQRKVEEIGVAMSYIAATLANFDEDDRKPSAKQHVVGDGAAYDILQRYGLAKDYFEGDHQTISYGNVQKLQTDVKYEMDVSNNDLQQDTATLQSFVSKRDGAYQMATKLMRKALQTRSTGIRYMR